MGERGQVSATGIPATSCLVTGSTTPVPQILLLEALFCRQIHRSIAAGPSVRRKDRLVCDALADQDTHPLFLRHCNTHMGLVVVRRVRLFQDAKIA